jgi:hypothetical protein
MIELTAQLPRGEMDECEQQIRAAARAHGAAEAPITAFDPFQEVSAVLSDPEDAIGLVRRGVRVVPFAETTPLLPLYAARGEEVPAELRVAHESQRYDFLLVQLTFSLRLEEGEEPDHAEFAVWIQDGVPGPRASRAIEVFPQRVHASWFKADAQLSVALDASLKFSVAAEGAAGAARASGDAGAGGKVLIGPFHVDAGRTELEVRGEGDREIGWIYRVRRALEGKNDFRSFLVIKVAQETEKVGLLARIGVRPYRRSWKTAWLREKLPILHADAVLDLELPKRAG